MKAAPFDYVRPASLADAVAELSARDGGAKVIAGGQSLVPVLAMRLARPESLVDINAIAELGTLAESGGRLTIGATVRQRRLERDPLGTSVPLLRQALPWVGHRELRSRGTVCGSLAHADPSAELPAVACCLGAAVSLTGPAGTREVPARDFFTGAMTTALGWDEVLSALHLPTAGLGDGFGFAEVARRHGDFALAGVAVHVARRTGTAPRAVLTAFGVSDRPVTRDLGVELELLGDPATPEPAAVARLRGPMESLAADVVDTEGDAHGSRSYRMRLLAALAARELVRSDRRARRGTEEART